MSDNKVKFSVTCTPKNKAKFQALKEKGGLTYDELIEYLLKKANLTGYRGLLRGSIKVESKLIDWLTLGHEKKITATELQRWCGVDYNTCKKTVALYKDEIDKFNLQFKS
jgi:hypothetical protein